MCLQLTSALSSCGNGEAVEQSCCSLSSVLAARRCHCRLGVPRQAKAQLEHIHYRCMHAHREIVEQQIFHQLPPGASPVAAVPGGFQEAAKRLGREAAPGTWGDLAQASSGRDAPAQGAQGEDTSSARESPGVDEEESEDVHGQPTYAVFGSGGTGGQPTGRPVKLFVGVLTAGKNADRRAAIRESWGSDRRLHRCEHLHHCQLLGTLLISVHHNSLHPSSFRDGTAMCCQPAWTSATFAASQHILELVTDVTMTHSRMLDSWQGRDEALKSGILCRRVMFFSAKPVDEAVFDALRKEAAKTGDIVVLPGIFEHYDNITHQTLEILRAASMDPVATHALKVQPVTLCQRI